MRHNLFETTGRQHVSRGNAEVVKSGFGIRVPRIGSRIPFPTEGLHGPNAAVAQIRHSCINESHVGHDGAVFVSDVDVAQHHGVGVDGSTGEQFVA